MTEEMDKGMRKWKVRDILSVIKNVFVAILRGELLLRLNMGQYFLHIIFLFFAFGMVIWASLGIDSTMRRVEENKMVIEELKITKSRKEFEYMSMYRRSTIASMLEADGSKVTQRELPATSIAENEEK